MFCNVILTESNPWEITQLSGKTHSHIRTPVPQSSVIYFSNDGTPFCLAALITIHSALSNSVCASKTIVVNVSYCTTYINIENS